MPASTPTTNQLLDLAHKITGHPVMWHRGGPKGSWDGHRITLRHGMSDNQTRSTIAHELAHAAYQDPPGHHPGRERRADRTAARFLITTASYARAEQMYGADIHRIADELGTTTHLATIWRDTHERTTP